MVGKRRRESKSGGPATNIDWRGIKWFWGWFTSCGKAVRSMTSRRALAGKPMCRVMRNRVS